MGQSRWMDAWRTRKHNIMSLLLYLYWRKWDFSSFCRLTHHLAVQTQRHPGTRGLKMDHDLCLEWSQVTCNLVYHRTSRFSDPSLPSSYIWNRSTQDKNIYHYSMSVKGKRMCKQWKEVCSLAPVWHNHAHPEGHSQAWHLYRWHRGSGEKSRPLRHRQCRIWCCIRPDVL